MLKTLKVDNFQSIEKADLELGALTVVVGASNSGKSALLRAVKTVAHNANGASFVRAGKPHANIGLVLAEGDNLMAVVLERGPSHSKYSVIIHDSVAEYPKSGTKVPEDVAKILMFPEVEGETLNFSFQFDRPFLLDWPTTRVAKALGDLSNVNIVYDAVREANRRKLEANARLKVRKGDVEELMTSLQEYVDLPGRLAAMDRADTALKRAALLEKAADRLATLLATHRTVEAALSNLHVPPEPPSLDRAEKLAAALVRLRSLLRQHEADDRRVEGEQHAITSSEELLTESEANYHQALVDAGVCPTCGQEVHG